MRFEPLLQRYIWGGRRLGSVLHKPIGREATCAESWEVCDHGSAQSIVANGPLRGTSLRELVTSYGEAIFGRHYPQRRFPLLMKFLDAAQPLSVQVHPDDARAAQLTPPDLGKTEAWVILDAAENSLIYSGLKPGVTAEQLAAAVRQGNCQELLHAWRPKRGDCILVPAGGAHALGAGILVAEIQQASDTTYRLFDWNRLGPDGNPRPLHIEQAIEAIDYTLGPILPQTPPMTGEPGAQRGVQADIERLVACDKFVLNRHTIFGPKTIANDDRFRILSVIEGEVTIEGLESVEVLNCGDTLLVPATWGKIDLAAKNTAVLLEAHLP